MDLRSRSRSGSSHAVSRRGLTRWPAHWLLGLGIAATLETNVAHGLGHGPIGAEVASWLAIALALDALQEEMAEVFADQLAADRVPSVRAIRVQFHVGPSGARRLRDGLAAGVGRT